MDIYTIYKATNIINTKVYIGFTSKDLRYRKSQHKKATTNSHFHNAIKKYGFDVFAWEILYQSKEKDYCLLVMEPHFITEYDSFNIGYNMTLGGDNNPMYHEHCRLNLSETRIHLGLGKLSGKYLKPLYGDDNPMRDIDILTKYKQKITGRKKTYKPDGSWCWTHPDNNAD